MYSLLFTTIPGVGKGSAHKLRDAGIHTLEDLKMALFKRELGQFSDRVKEALFQYVKEGINTK